jgi:histidinol-phosphate/aromatic aminotransferase/cobyric acid decarboxylase-like protein
MLEARDAVKKSARLSARLWLAAPGCVSISTKAPSDVRRACWPELRSLDAEALARYPEREPVEKLVASFLGLDPAQVLLTNGVDEAIHLLCSTYLDPWRRSADRCAHFRHVCGVRALAEGARVIEVPPATTLLSRRKTARSNQPAHAAHRGRESEQSDRP